eukprot:scaffold14949_cov112-Skeletonema_dohrnii-CCMP3373.AAC.1
MAMSIPDGSEGDEFSVKSRSKRKIHKYGIEVPQSVMMHAARIKRVKQHDVAGRSIHYHLRSKRLVRPFKSWRTWILPVGRIYRV